MPVEDWDDLRYLLAVERAGSFKAAAEAMGAETSTVSRRIARIEAKAGARLFSRGPGGGVPTDRAMPMLHLARQIERQIQAHGLSSGEAPAAGRVRLWCTEGMAAYWLPPSLMAFRSAHPDIHVQTLATSRLPDPRSAEADMAIVYAMPPDEDGWVRMATGRSTFRMCASTLYLAERGRPERWDDLRRHDMLTTPQLPTGGAWAAWGALIDNHPRIVSVMDSSIALGWATAYGLGFSPQPTGLIAREKVLVGFDFPEFGPVDEFYLVCRRELREMPHIRRLADHLRGTLFGRDAPQPALPWEGTVTIATAERGPRGPG